MDAESSDLDAVQREFRKLQISPHLAKQAPDSAALLVPLIAGRALDVLEVTTDGPEGSLAARTLQDVFIAIIPIVSPTSTQLSRSLEDTV